MTTLIVSFEVDRKGVVNKSAKCSCVAPADYLFYRPLTFGYQINHHEKLANCSNLEPVFEASSANYGFFFFAFF